MDFIMEEKIMQFVNHLRRWVASGLVGQNSIELTRAWSSLRWWSRR